MEVDAVEEPVAAVREFVEAPALESEMEIHLDDTGVEVVSEPVMEEGSEPEIQNEEDQPLHQYTNTESEQLVEDEEIFEEPVEEHIKEQAEETMVAQPSPAKIKITTASSKANKKKKRVSLIPVPSPVASPVATPVTEQMKTPEAEKTTASPSKLPRVSTVKTTRTTKVGGLFNVTPLKSSTLLPHNRMLEYKQPMLLEYTRLTDAHAANMIAANEAQEAATQEAATQEEPMDTEMNDAPYEEPQPPLDIFRSSSILSPNKASFASPRKPAAREKFLNATPARANSPKRKLGQSPLRSVKSTEFSFPKDFASATPTVATSQENVASIQPTRSVTAEEEANAASPTPTEQYQASPRKHLSELSVLPQFRLITPALSKKASFDTVTEQSSATSLLPQFRVNTPALSKQTSMPALSEQTSFSLTPPSSPTKSAMRSPARQLSPKKSVTFNQITAIQPILEEERPWNSRPTPGLLAGLCFFVDVNTSEGANARHLFVPLLEEMGAGVVPHWTSNNMDITHVLFKDGDDRTLEKVIASNGGVKCVNVGWAVE